MTLSIGNPSRNHDEPEITLQQERSNEIEQNKGNLDGITHKVEHSLEKNDVLAKYPEEIKGVLKEALVKEIYTKHGEGADIGAIGQGISPTTKDNFIMVRVGEHLSASIKPDQLIEKYAQEHPKFDIEGLKANLTEHTRQESIEKTFNTEKNVLSGAFQKASDERSKAVATRSDEIDKASFLDKIRGKVPEPIPSLKEESLSSKEVLRFVEPKFTKSETFQKMLDEMITRLDHSETKDIGSEFWDALKPPNQSIIKHFDEGSKFAETKREPSAQTGVDIKDDLKISSEIHIKESVGDRGEIKIDLSGEHKEKTTAVKGEALYTRTDGPLKTSISAQGEAKNTLEQGVQYSFNTGIAANIEKGVSDNGTFKISADGKYEASNETKTTTANSKIDYTLKTESLNVNTNAFATWSETQTLGKGSQQNLKIGGAAHLDSTWDNNKVTADIGAERVVSNDKTSTKANGEVVYTHKTESLNINANVRSEVERTQTLGQDSQHKNKVSGGFNVEDTFGDNQVNIKINGERAVSNETTTTKINGEVLYTHKTESLNINANVRSEVERIQTLGQDLQHKNKVSGGFNVENTFGDNQVNIKINGERAVSNETTTTKINGEVLYAYKTESLNINANVRSEVERIQTLGQDSQHKNKVSGGFSVENALGDGKLKIGVDGYHNVTNGTSDFNVSPTLSYQYRNWGTNATGNFGGGSRSGAIGLTYQPNDNSQFNVHLNVKNERNPLNNQWNKDWGVSVGVKLSF